MQNLVTVFGGSGFVGAQAVRCLAKAGWRIRVAVRNPNLAYSMRLLGDVGQVDVVQANVRDTPSLERALEDAAAALNLTGILFEAGRQTFATVHVEGAAKIAQTARAQGVTRMIQMSALGADPASSSKYARSKAEGEAAVRAIYPDAAIVRPSVVFGPGDGFFEKFARMASMSPVLPLVGGGTTRFQPVFVGDVGEALARIVTDAASAGQTFELAGPAAFSFRELMEMLLAEIGKRRVLLPIPTPVAGVLAAGFDWITAIGLSGLIPPAITRDQLQLLKSDNVPSGLCPGLSDLGVTPTTLEAVLPTYLYMYRKGGQYADQEQRAFATL